MRVSRADTPVNYLMLRTIGLSLLLAVLAASVFHGQEQPPEPATPPPSPGQPIPPAKRLPLNVNLRIEGLVSVSESDAKDLVKDHWKSITIWGLNSSRADDAAYLLRLGLRRLGYPDSQVEWKIVGGGRTLLLIVNEGNSTDLNEVRFKGENQFTDEELRSIILKETRGRQRLIDMGKKPFVSEDIDDGVKAMLGYYRSYGYLDATATWSSEPSREKKAGTVDVLVVIEEGSLYHIGKVTVSGDDPAEVARQQERVNDLMGADYSGENLQAIENRILGDFQERGFFRSDLEMVETDREEIDGTDLPLRVIISPGGVYHITQFEFVGNAVVPDDFMHKRFASLQDTPYDPEKVNKIFGELASSGLFTSLEVDPVPFDAGKIRLRVTVEEDPKPRSFGVYGGVSSFDGGILGFTYENRNIFGLLRPLRGRIEFNGRGYEGNITYTDPWFFETRYAFSFNAFAATRELEGYDKFDFGLRGVFTRRIFEKLSVSAFIESVHTEITDDDFADNVDIGLTSYWRQSIGAAWTWDTRNNPLTPKTGYVIEGRIEGTSEFLGSDVNFLRGTLRYSHYWPIGKTKLRFGARVGVVVPFGDTDPLPIDLRFFTGGSNSVRSFPDRELGRTDRKGNPLGGEFYTIFNLEYSYPIAGALDLAVFVDAGNLLPRAEDASLDDMHYAAGIGLRYDLPIGPLRLDYGWNLNEQKREPSGTFHFSFGFAF